MLERRLGYQQSSKTDRKNIEHELEGIHYLYTFYANQHSKVGHDPTFGQMQGDTQAIDNGSFLRFCRDFLLAGSRTDATIE